MNVRIVPENENVSGRVLEVERDEGGAVDEGTEELAGGAEAEEGFHGEVGEDEGDHFPRKIHHCVNDRCGSTVNSLAVSLRWVRINRYAKSRGYSI